MDKIKESIKYLLLIILWLISLGVGIYIVYLVIRALLKYIGS